LGATVDMGGSGGLGLAVYTGVIGGCGAGFGMSSGLEEAEYVLRGEGERGALRTEETGSVEVGSETWLDLDMVGLVGGAGLGCDGGAGFGGGGRFSGYSEPTADSSELVGSP